MITVGYACESCSHKINTDSKGERIYPYCAAFPEGIPADWFMHGYPDTKEECANGIKYEERKEE